MREKIGFLLSALVWAQKPIVSGYDLWLDSLNFTSRSWHWRAGIAFRPNSASSLTLSLQGYRIDSVRLRGVPVSYTYNDSLLVVPLSGALQPVETLVVYYHGSGITDPTQRGGIYWGNNSVYNVGVSFAYIPHSFGRAWHPCVDTFGHKAAYRFHLRVPDSLAGTANGLLDSVVEDGTGWKYWHWHVPHPLPAYLAGVAIGEYVAAQDTFIRGNGDTIPIQYWVRRRDSSGAYVTFQRLKPLLRDWEQKFGPYPHRRIGYVGTPATNLAMEHSTHIVYPELIIANNTQYDWLWAHELSHEWFGNSVTGSSEQQIFLKEGFATYAEALYYERFLGKARAYEHIQSFLERTLRLLRWEEGLFPLSAIPLEHTYGIATYQKGATVLHTLRHQLGDSLYFLGVRTYTSRYAHGLTTIDSLQRAFEEGTGISLQAFFDDWLRKSGEVHFRIDSFGRQGNDSVWIAWRMSLRDKPSYSTPTRLTVYLRGARRGDTLYAQFFTDGRAQGRAVVACPFNPLVAILHPNGEVSDASTHATRWLRNNANTPLSYVHLILRPTGLPSGDSVWVHVAHHWVAPYDAGTLPLSNARYYQIDGTWGKELAMRGFFAYNGTAIGAEAYLDTVWLSFPEDSLALYWRPRAGEPWREWTYYTVQLGNNPSDKRGRIAADSLLPGEYAIGRKVLTPSTLSSGLQVSGWEVWSSPGHIHLRNTTPYEGAYAVYDLLGRLHKRGHLSPYDAIAFPLPAGMYIIQAPDKLHKVFLGNP